MYAVSQGFLTALQGQQIYSSILVTTTDGTTLPIASGAVTMDSRRDITRTCELELIPNGRTAKQLYDLVMGSNTELTVRRGIQVNGAVEYVPLGVFSTDGAEYSKSVQGLVRWSGSDRSKRVSRARFIDPYSITSGTSLVTAGTALLQSRYANIPCNFSNIPTNVLVGANITYDAGADSDPWASARSLFADYGYDLNFDGSGNARAVSIPDPATTAPAFDFGSTTTNLVTGGSVQGSMESAYTGVIASGEGSEVVTPVRAIAWDTDPNSPTYYQSGLGQVPYFYSSPLLTTVDACTLAANTILARIKGRTDQFAWPAIVNPALEPLDVVTVTLGGVKSTLVIDSLTIPLKATDEMSATARLVVNQ